MSDETTPDGPRVVVVPAGDDQREDLAGPALGGNKIRKLELLLGAARAEGADTVITSAAWNSNFCRALAGCAARLGLRSVLLLRGERPPELQGNLLLDHLFGAAVRPVSISDPWGAEAIAALG